MWTIPGHVVHERLHADVVSATYLASRTSDGYPVVLEVVSEDPDDPLAAERFRTTVTQVAAVRHPVLPVVSVTGESDGVLYTISSAVEGRPLHTLLADAGPLPLDDTLAVCRELADALDLLASAGVTHGAVGPTTVWINDRVRAPSAPYVSLRGVGTAPLRAARAAEPDTAPPPDLLWTAPEQVKGTAPTPPTDQYALACLVMHCLTGSPPYDGATIAQLFDAHVSREPDDGVLHADRLPRRMVAGVRRALAKDPDDRFPTCAEFATAIGAEARPSWMWMVEEGPAADDVSVDIDLRDGAGARTTRRHQAPAAARSLSEVDWLPGPATRTSPPRPATRQPSVPAGRGPNPVAVPRRPRRIPTRWARWAGLALFAAVVVIAGAAVGRTILTSGRVAPAADVADQPTGAGIAEMPASWREPVADGPVDVLVAREDGILSVRGSVVDSLDRGTGRSRWTTRLDAPVRQLSLLGPTVILRTTAELVALDRSDGAMRWRSSQTGLPDLEALATGRGRMFGLARDEGDDPVIHAIDPRTGELGWSLSAGSAKTTTTARDGGALLAFDGSRRSGRTLYVVEGGQLSAFSVSDRALRWRTTLQDAPVVSLTALAGAVLTVSADGDVCRHDGADGTLVWTTCPTLQRADAQGSIAQVRDSRVVVASAHEVLSVDFTSGTPQWRIVSDEELQPAIAANRAATYVAGPDGSVEAVAQHNGASLWMSAPFGPITAMSATEDAVYLTTRDGRLTRLEATAPEAVD